tara:strand:+ start:51 stop:260 length:210 start_codon:yes stop_codon:yes gene_type:complete
MLILSQSQAKNYFKKLLPTYHSEGCGCCNSSTDYEIKGSRILYISSGEYQGTRFFNVSVLAKIKKVRSN